MVAKYTKDGRILLDNNRVLLNFDKTICTEVFELISSDEYYAQFVKPKESNRFFNLSSRHNAELDKANDKLIHGL